MRLNINFTKVLVWTIHKQYLWRTSQQLSHTVGHLFSRATNFVNGLNKEVQGNHFHESTLVILAYSCCYSCTGALSLSAPCSMYVVLTITLYKRCLLVSNAHLVVQGDMNSWKIRFCIMSNSVMHVARSLYVLTTYQYFRCGWHINWSSYTRDYTNHS